MVVVVATVVVVVAAAVVVVAAAVVVVAAADVVVAAAVVVVAAAVVVVGAAVVVVVGAAVVVVGAAVVVVGALVVVVVVVVVVAKGVGGVWKLAAAVPALVFLASTSTFAAVFFVSSVPASTTAFTAVAMFAVDVLIEPLLVTADEILSLASALSVVLVAASDSALFKSAAVGLAAVSVLSALLAAPVTIVTALNTLVALF